MHINGIFPYSMMALMLAADMGYYDEDTSEEEREAILNEITDLIMDM